MAQLSSKFNLVIALMVLFLILSVAAPNFLTARNLLNVLRVSAVTGIIACPMTFMIISGDIDVSVGSAIAWSSSLLGVLVIIHGWPIYLAIFFVFFQATLLHSGAAYLRTYYHIPSFVVTLSLFMSLQGAARYITGAWSITPFPSSFAFWGQGYLFKTIPVPVIFMLATFVFFHFLSTRTIYGRSVYSVGGNEEASRLSGISVWRVRLITYILTGFFTALSSIILTSRIAAGSSKIGSGMEFEVIASVIIGGTSLSGGRGSIIGTLLGVLFIRLLRNGMVLMGVDTFIQEISSGIVILVAVIISELHKSKNTSHWGGKE